jgi:Zn-dependent M28 family amino/carboxypeptidase
MVLDVPVVVLPAGTPVAAEVTLKTPARRDVFTPVHNVAGVVRGRDPELSKQCLLISAHLDHIGVGSRGGSDDTINNGADDNATGVTGVLMLAEAYAALDPAPRRSVMFVTFWGEEKGLLGSQEFAANSPWPLRDIVANLNLEMLGRPESGAENKGWCTGWTHSDFGELLAAGAQRADVTIFRHERFDEMLYSRSDNFSFVQKGVIAHSVSAGSLHDDYHQPGDEVSKLNLPHMTAVIRGLFAGSLPIAEGQLTPVRR